MTTQSIFHSLQTLLCAGDGRSCSARTIVPDNAGRLSGTCHFDRSPSGAAPPRPPGQTGTRRGDATKCYIAIPEEPSERTRNDAERLAAAISWWGHRWAHLLVAGSHFHRFMSLKYWVVYPVSGLMLHSSHNRNKGGSGSHISYLLIGNTVWDAPGTSSGGKMSVSAQRTHI
jgi:hypothetical protein